MEKDKTRKSPSLDSVVVKIGDGHYVRPVTKKDNRYDIKALDRYCKSKGVSPSQLSKKELEKFQIGNKKDNMVVL